MLILRQFSLILVFILSIAVLHAQVGFEGEILTNTQVFTGLVQSQPSSPLIVKYPKHGDYIGFSPQGNGKFEFSYTPDENYEGLDELTIEVRDGWTTYNYVTFKFKVVKSIVTPKNDYDYVAMNGSTVSRGVLSNDYASHPPLHANQIAFVEGGEATISNGMIHFSPDSGYSGMAHIRYIACDSLGTCGTGLLTISVLDGESIDLTMDLATTKNIPVEAPLEWTGYEIDSAPTNGTAQINDGLELVYTPNEDFYGTDNFTITKGQLTKEVSVTVYNKAKPNKYAILDRVFTPRNTPVTFNVRSNDYGNYYVKGFTQPGIGTLVYNGGGNFTYTPANNYTSGVKFTYQIGTSSNPNVEEGTVELLIGNQAPYKGTFDLTTTVGAPLIIKYPTTFTDFGYEEINAPNHGSLEFLEGEQTITIDGEEVTGNNMLLYYPEEGFTGVDEFDVYYCLLENEECEEVKVNVEVLDAPATCFDDCIWPGDANADGEVNVTDLLMIGQYFGTTGPARIDNTTDWYAHAGENWDIPFSPIDLKHCDINGDGLISAADTAGIGLAYAKNDNLVPFIPTANKQINIEFGTPSVSNPQPGDFVSIPLILGSDNYPAVDVYGFTFNINYWKDAFDGAYISYEEESWLTQNDGVLSIAKAPYNGRLESALTRTGLQAASGQGIIGSLNFIIDDELDGIKTDGSLEITIDGGSVSNANGVAYGINNGSTTLQLNLAGTGLGDFDADKVMVYPNPSSEEINIHLNSGFVANKIEIMDAQGRKLFYVRGLESNHFVYPVTDLMPGVYMAKVYTVDGVVFKRFTVIRK